MNAQPNIFETLSANNDLGEFESITEVQKPKRNQPATEFTETMESEATTEGNIFEVMATKQKAREANSFGFLDTLKDIGKQVGSKAVSGFGGAYGNLLDTFGLQQKSGETRPGTQERNSQQFAVLEKLNRGEVPSFGELMLLSDDDFPDYNRLPSSKEIQQGIEGLTGIGEGETPAGRIFGRGAEFVSEGLAYPGGGVKGLLSLAGAGLAGQGIREVAGPEALATATEIGGSLLPSLIQGRVNPRNARDVRTANNARNFGFNEREIAPLIQSDAKIATLKPLARKGSKTQQLFEDIQRGSGQIYDQIHQMPGAQNAISRQAATTLENSLTGIRNNLSNTLQASPDKQAALTFIDGALNELRNNPNASASTLMNFWSDINGAVNWNAIKGGKKQLARLKDPLHNALNSVSPEIAENFQNINELYSRFKNISNKLKPDLVDSFLNKGEIASAIPSGLALVYGNPTALMGLGGEVATRLLAREMLINPYFQNIGNKLVTNFNQGSLKAVEETVKQVQDYMKRKHPNEDWTFLTDNLKDEEG